MQNSAITTYAATGGGTEIIMKIGAQLYTLSRQCQTLDNFADSLARVADMGYKTVQVSGVCPYEPQWLKEQLDKNGLTCELTHPSMDRIRDPDKLVADQNVYSCKYMGVSWMPPEYRGSLEKAKEFCDLFYDSATRIKSLGSQLMYHNHWFEYDDIGGINFMDYLTERFSPELLGITLDTYWVEFAGRNVADEINRLAGRLPRIHLKDMEILANGQKRYAPVGYGVMDFEKICEAAVSAGTEIAFVEQDECFERDPFDCLKMSLEYLKSIGYEA